MKRLKYIKLFEAFESIKLTKVLGYISSQSTAILIDNLKKLAKKYDFPISKFSDDMFQYLPYKKALEVKVNIDGIPCQATSKSLFQDAGIEGESCKSGKIARLWGSSTRVVNCPNCGGTGIQKKKSDLSIIKFWFTKEGNFVCMTGCDGVLREPNNSLQGVIKPSGAAFRRLKHLDEVMLTTRRGSKPVKSTVYIEGGDVFCIQNVYDGGTPSGGNWRDFGRFSWNISSGDFFEIYPMVKADDTKTDANDPLRWNVVIDKSFSPDPDSSIKSAISDAHFALVLDLNLLKSGGFMTKSQISDQRAEQKSGSLFGLTDEEIKKENIEKRFKELALRSDIVENISNLDKFVQRSTGANQVLFLLKSDRLIRKIETVIDLYYDIMREKDVDEKNELCQQLSTRISSFIQSVMDKKTNVTKNLQSLKTEISDKLKNARIRHGVDGSEHLTDCLEIISKLEKTSQIFADKLRSHKNDTIEDLEAILLKLLSLQTLTQNFSELESFMESLSTTGDDCYYWLVEYYRVQNNSKKILSNLERCQRIISRL